MRPVTQRYVATAYYTGSNGAAIAAEIGATVVTGPAGSPPDTLWMLRDGMLYALTPGQCMIAFWDGSTNLSAQGAVNAAEFAAYWADLVASADVAALGTRVTTAEGRLASAETRLTAAEMVRQSGGKADLGLPLLVGQSRTLQVPLNPAFPDTAYSAAPVVTNGTGLLPNLAVVSWTNVSGSRVDVTVRNDGLATLTAASVLVYAVRS